jgi:hypothetical protein
MRWDSKNGEILELRTRPDVRRRGVATGMFQYGQQYEPAPRHSSSRSPEGDRFAKSTGTSVPKLRKKIPSESSLDLSHEEAMRMAKD